MHESREALYAVKLRREMWERRMNAKGLDTDRARAQCIGVSRWTVARIQSGEIVPGERFVAAVLGTFDDLKFEEIFEVVQMPVGGAR